MTLGFRWCFWHSAAVSMAKPATRSSNLPRRLVTGRFSQRNPQRFPIGSSGRPVWPAFSLRWFAGHARRVSPSTNFFPSHFPVKFPTWAVNCGRCVSVLGPRLAETAFPHCSRPRYPAPPHKSRIPPVQRCLTQCEKAVQIIRALASAEKTGRSSKGSIPARNPARFEEETARNPAQPVQADVGPNKTRPTQTHTREAFRHTLADCDQLRPESSVERRRFELPTS